MQSKIPVYWHPDMIHHDTAADHPAMAPNRLGFLAKQLQDSNICLMRDASLRGIETMQLVHDHDYLQQLYDTRELGTGEHYTFAQDTLANHQTWTTLSYSIGSVCDAIDRVQAGERAAFCVTYAGHHARRNEASGFCFVNNVSVGAQYGLSKGMNRVAILDFDTHSGDGTVLTSLHDSRIFFGETYQPGFPGKFLTPGQYPMQFIRHEMHGADLFRDCWEHIFEQTALFQPDLILVSAGFDAHFEDPLSRIGIYEQTYAWLGERLAMQRAPVVCCLEGGYNLRSTRLSMIAFLEQLSRKA